MTKLLVALASASHTINTLEEKKRCDSYVLNKVLIETAGTE